MKLIIKKTTITILMLLITSTTAAPIVSAATNSFGVDYGDGPGNGDMFGMSYVEDLGLSSGNGLDPRAIIINILKYLLTFMGILALCIVMLAGFKYMTSSGSADKIAEAKGMLVSSFIGIIIIMAAYSITNFVINSVAGALAGGNSGI